MLINLTQDTCVAKFSSANIDHWILYSPSNTANNKKRITWEKNTGLLTTNGMQTWLEEHFPHENHAITFSNIVARSCQK